MLGVEASSKSGLVRRPRLRRSGSTELAEVFALPWRASHKGRKGREGKKQKLNFPYLCDLVSCPRNSRYMTFACNHSSSHGGGLITVHRPESRLLILQLLNSCNS